MRYILFLAALGVVAQGVKLTAGNPAATVFQSAAGELGYRFFGMVMWSAAITSVVGASYTSVSFWKTISPFVQRNEKGVTTVFILFSTLIFLFVGQPVRLLVLAGAVNGFILPIALAVILVASGRQKVVGDYRHPAWLQWIGWLVVVAMGYMGVVGIMKSVQG